MSQTQNIDSGTRPLLETTSPEQQQYPQPEETQPTPSTIPIPPKQQQNNPPQDKTPKPRTLLPSLPNPIKNHALATLAELTGTFLFLLPALGTTTTLNTLPVTPDPAAKLLLISLAFGLSLAATASVFYRVTGGLFNPAVTLGLVLVGALGRTRGALVAVGQVLGAVAACAVLEGVLPGPFRGGTELRGDVSVVRGVFLEMFLTGGLVLAVFMLAVEKHRGTFLAPGGIGGWLFVAELVGVSYTGGSLNPARSFGPAVVTGSFPSYHWIYWVGPFLGALLASACYLCLKGLDYEAVNPGQDDAGGADVMVVNNSGYKGIDGGSFERGPGLEAGERTA